MGGSNLVNTGVTVSVLATKICDVQTAKFTQSLALRTKRLITCFPLLFE